MGAAKQTAESALIQRWQDWGTWRNLGGMDYDKRQTVEGGKSQRNVGEYSNPTLAKIEALEGSRRDIVTERCYQAMSTGLRAVVRLRYVEKLAIYGERGVMARLSITESAYKQRHSRAVEALKAEIAADRYLQRERLGRLEAHDEIKV